MKKFKRFLTLVLVFSMMLNHAPLSVFAEETAATEEPVVEETVMEEQIVEETEEILIEESVEEVVVEETEEELPVEEQEFSDEQEEVLEEPVEEEKTENVETVQFNLTKTTNNEVTTTAITYANEYRILHLDCGRKFFSKEWINALINEMAAAGYTHLELAFGNDGLRFLLDDMSVNGYTDDQVTAAIQAGNKKYHDFGTVNELTESDMNEIILHAQNNGIQIIPLLNNPGHMDAIVTAISSLTGTSAGYKGSSSTVDLENSDAVSFTKTLLSKYIAYFEEKGCNEFNMGADEYANDVYPNGSMGFGALSNAGKYQLFVDYVNSIASMIKESNMVPIAFNDGIYFNNATSYNFDKDISVAFWTSGWTNYQSASASTMESLGHKMINVHGDYYYICGKDDIWTPGEKNTTHDPQLYTAAADFNMNTFMGSTVNNPLGAMFCIWCDYPGFETETQVAANVRLVLRAMAAEMKGGSASAISTEVVPGGFNEDGTINCNKVTVTDAETGVKVNACDLTNLTATLVVEEDIPEVDGAVNVVAWDMTPYVGETKYAGSATVELPVPEEWNTNKLVGFYVENEQAIQVNGTYAGGYYSFEMPHFSVGGLALLDIEEEPVYQEVVELEVGGTHEITIKNVEYNGEYKTNPEGIATVVAEHEEKEGDTKITSVSSITADNSYYLYSKSDGKFLTTELNLADSYENTEPWVATSLKDYYLFVYNDKYLGNTWSDGWVLLPSAYENGVELFSWSAEGWVGDMSGYLFDIYEVGGVESVNQSTITFTGSAPGTTYSTVGDTTYKIVVTGEVNITIKYVDENNNVIKSEVVTVRDNATSYTVSNFNYGGKYYVVENPTFDINPTSQDEYTVVVTETKVNLETVEPLTIEYWITNGRVEDDNDKQFKEINASDEGIYSAEGVSVNELVPDRAKRENRFVDFWQIRYLDITESNDSTSGTQHQSEMSGDDETQNGYKVEKIRYWDGAWEVYIGTWESVDQTETTITYQNKDNIVTYTGSKNQIVAYYMESMEITNSNGQTEVLINSADWGTKGDGKTAWDSNLNDSKVVSLSIQIVYEDGSVNPSSTDVEALKEKTFMFHDWGVRGVGTLLFTGNGDYQIYRLQAQTGNIVYSTSNNVTNITKFEWNDDTATVWEGKQTDQVSVSNPTDPSSTILSDPLDNLAWQTNEGNKNNAILIKVYVKAKVVAAQDALHVHYVDSTANDLEFYNYEIPVTQGTVFDDGFAMSDNNSLTNNTVDNYYGQTQTVSADLSSMPQIAAYYRYCNYTLEEVERSADGKDVYLYYTFTPVVSFVADFGLPLEITPDQLIKNADGEYKEDASFTDGTIQSIKVIGTYDTSAGTSAESVYGSLTVSGNNVVYTPTKVLKGVDFFTIFVQTNEDTLATEDNEEQGIAYRVYVYPATTVYYEEGFIENWTGTWESKGSKGTNPQTTSALSDGTRLGEAYRYGYDSVYDGNNISSNGTEAISKVGGNDASFSFTGTGVEVYAKGTTNSGTVLVQIKDSTDKAIKMFMVNTVAASGTTDATAGQSTTLYNMPIVSVQDLPHGTYTVYMRHIMNNQPIYIDGFRVFNAHQSAVYAQDVEPFIGENGVVVGSLGYVELRDLVLSAANVIDNVDDSIYDLAQGIKSQVYEDVGTLKTVVYVSDSDEYVGQNQLKDLLDNGPKNELYLYPKQAITFTLNQDYITQIGLKSVTGAEVSYSFNNGTTAETEKEYKLSSTVDMFYHKGAQGTITITNNSENNAILSVTLLKYFSSVATAGDVFEEVSEEQISWALMSLRRPVVDEEIETPDISEPEIDVPEVIDPEIGTPDVSEPEVDTPEVTDPEVETPEIVTPETGNKEETVPGQDETTEENKQPTGAEAPEGKPSTEGNETVEPEESETEEVTPDNDGIEDEEESEETVTPDVETPEVNKGFFAALIDTIVDFIVSLITWFTGIFA